MNLWLELLLVCNQREKDFCCCECPYLVICGIYIYSYMPYVHIPDDFMDSTYPLGDLKKTSTSVMAIPGSEIVFDEERIERNSYRFDE